MFTVRLKFKQGPPRRDLLTAKESFPRRGPLKLTSVGSGRGIILLPSIKWTQQEAKPELRVFRLKNSVPLVRFRLNNESFQWHGALILPLGCRGRDQDSRQIVGHVYGDGPSSSCRVIVISCNLQIPFLVTSECKSYRIISYFSR